MQAQESPPPRAPRPPPRPAPPDEDPRPLPSDVPLSSIVVEDVGPVTPETGVADVLLGSIALVGALLVASLVVGVLVGTALVYVKHKLGYGGPEADRAQHVELAIGRNKPQPPA